MTSQQSVYRTKTGGFRKAFSHNGYAYDVSVSRKEYICQQLGISRRTGYNNVVKAFLKHIGEEYYIVQTQQHCALYQVALYTDVKPDDGPIELVESTQIHIAMYDLMSEYLWHCQQLALALFNAEQERLFADHLAREAARDYDSVTVGPWTPEAIALGNTHG